MSRATMTNAVGVDYLTSNIEGGEYSYAQAAGGREELRKILGYTPSTSSWICGSTTP